MSRVPSQVNKYTVLQEVHQYMDTMFVRDSGLSYKPEPAQPMTKAMFNHIAAMAIDGWKIENVEIIYSSSIQITYSKELTSNETL